MNWNRCGMKQSWPNIGYSCRQLIEQMRKKEQEISVRRANIKSRKISAASLFIRKDCY
jgi:hypothetical protein